MTYNGIPGMVPYVCPVNPGPLNLPHPATQHQIVAARDMHTKNTFFFKKPMQLKEQSSNKVSL
eukprot:10628017-Ditylum_brightwellii.AAC.1